MILVFQLMLRKTIEVATLLFVCSPTEKNLAVVVKNRHNLPAVVLFGRVGDEFCI